MEYISNNKLDKSIYRQTPITDKIEEVHNRLMERKFSKKGTVLDRVLFVVLSYDIDVFFERSQLYPEQEKALRTREEIQELRTTFKTEKQIKEYSDLLIMYLTGNSFFVRLVYTANEAYEKHCKEQLSYLAIKEEIEKECEDLTNILNSLSDPTERETFLRLALKVSRHGVKLSYDGKVFAPIYVDGEGTLLHKIRETKSKIEYTLKSIKASLGVLMQYYGDKYISLFPVHVRTMYTLIEGEYTLRSNPEIYPYLRSKTLEKKERGETVSPEEEFWNVFPDFGECEPSETEYIFARNALEIAKGYEYAQLYYETYVDKE